MDLIDQAILVVYIGPKLSAKLVEVRAIGVRGAIEMGLLAERRRLLDPTDPRRDEADRTVKRIADVLGEPDTATTRNLIQNLDEDEQVELIWNLWFEEPAKGVLGEQPIPDRANPAPIPDRNVVQQGIDRSVGAPPVATNVPAPPPG